ncbi:hypothetical protein [Promicromonospora umidemergens]|uniref:HTH cro/C1-type domain-containing protein n=1 Tax=Promicromonospora umidemergens TaxID=629679 RepID=A0ABP8XIA3_9MICO|nr:hypothetical protein [Promicromonospora umidemergens]
MMARSGKAEREQVRRRLQAERVPVAQIAVEMERRFAARPRTAWRYALGWDQWKTVQAYRIANAAAIDETRISKWESWPHGGTRPSLENLAGLVLAFGHGCTVAELVDDDDLEHLSPAERRLVGTLQPTPEPTASMADMSLEWADRVRLGFSDPRRFADAGLIDVFRLQLETAKAVDGRSGAAAALPTTLGVVAGLRSVLPDVPGRTQGTAFTLAAEAAELAGWLFRDLAEGAKAAYWYDQAMEYAQLCEDAGMQGYVLMRKSQMAYDAGDGHRVLGFARAALGGPWQLTALGQAEAILQRAKGQLMTDQHVDVENAIGRAREMAPDHQAVLHVREATCWIEAGQPERAVELYDSALSAPSLSTRDSGFFRARRSVALARAGLPNDAATTALEALDIAVHTGSGRTRRVVNDAATGLLRWRSSPAVEQLSHALSSSP